jgi:hypothetical protein
MIREQTKQLREFEKAVIATLDRINASGAIDDNTPDGVRLRYAIVLTAEAVTPRHQDFTAELANLRHF